MGKVRVQPMRYQEGCQQVQLERPRVLNFINLGGGHPLCTLHRAEGLYSWVTRRGYTRDSLYKSVSGILQQHRPNCLQGKAAQYVLTLLSLIVERILQFICMAVHLILSFLVSTSCLGGAMKEKEKEPDGGRKRDKFCT